MLTACGCGCGSSSYPVGAGQDWQMTGISILGIPNDDNSSFLKGPAEAPAHIRRELQSDAFNMWTETGIDLGVPGQLNDRGDVAFDDTTDPWLLIERAVADALDTGTPLISLGGDHAITHPIMRVVRRHQPRLTMVHIDAHPDIYQSFQDNPRSHASPFARIMEEGLADHLVQVGLRTISGHQREQQKRFSVEVHEARACTGNIRLELHTPVYLSIDMDGLDPAYAPGVSHREPGGLSSRQLINLIHAIDQPIVAADVVEYNPRCDVANITAIMAAKLVKEIAGVMVARGA